MNIKQESETKTRTNKYRYFLESNFVGISRLNRLYRENDVK